MAKVLLVVQQGFGARILLQTDILPELISEGSEVAVLTSDASAVKDYLEGRGFDPVNVVQMDTEAYGRCRARFLSKFFKRLRWFATSTRTARDNFIMEWKDAIRARRVSEVVVLAVTYVIKEMMCALPSFSRMMVALENMIDKSDAHAEFFKEYNPDVLVTTSVGSFDDDAYVMREARQAGCSIVSYVLSWDNTSVRGLGVNLSDLVIVWSNIMKEELVKFHGLSAERIKVLGVPHYDFYKRLLDKGGREKIQRELGLPDGKRFIFLGTKSPHCFLYNPDLAKVICESIQDGRLPEDCFLIVRLHPLYYRRRAGSETAADFESSEWSDLEKKYGGKCLMVNYPEIKDSEISFFMPDEEIQKLASLLFCSDLVVNMFSTLNIEASIFDTPTVNASYEYDYKKPRGTKVERFNMSYDEIQTHNQRIVHSGGTEVVHSEPEMIESIRKNLENPDLHSEGRKSIVERECGGEPGKSGVAVAKAILNVLN